MKDNKSFEKQIRFITYYLSEGTYTYSNLRRSALKAGYSDSYARKIGSHLKWEEMERALESVRDELKKLLT